MRERERQIERERWRERELERDRERVRETERQTGRYEDASYVPPEPKLLLVFGAELDLFFELLPDEEFRPRLSNGVWNTELSF